MTWLKLRISNNKVKIENSDDRVKFKILDYRVEV